MRHAAHHFRFVTIAAMTALLAGCGASQPLRSSASMQAQGLKTARQGVVAGGLAGADYDPASGIWVLTGDARSSQRPARLYSAR